MKIKLISAAIVLSLAFASIPSDSEAACRVKGKPIGATVCEITAKNKGIVVLTNMVPLEGCRVAIQKVIRSLEGDKRCE